MRETTVGEPPGNVVDGSDIDAGETEPGFLYGVLGLGPGPQDAPGDGMEVVTGSLEALRQRISFVHPVTPLRSCSS